MESAPAAFKGEIIGVGSKAVGNRCERLSHLVDLEVEIQNHQGPNQQCGMCDVLIATSRADHQDLALLEGETGHQIHAEPVNPLQSVGLQLSFSHKEVLCRLPLNAVEKMGFCRTD